MYPFYLGIDLHRNKSFAVLMDQNGDIVDERSFLNDEATQYLDQVVPKETFAVLEATRNWPFMYDLLAEHVSHVELAHPKELKAISTAAVKTDRIDARVLAQLARLNYLPTAYAAPIEVRDLRLYVRYRQFLINQRTRSKNYIHAILVRYNLCSPVSDLFGVKGREWLTEVLTGDSVRLMAKEVIANQLALIDRYQQHIDRLEDQLELSPEQRATIKLLKTVPGIGNVIALVLVAEIGDVHRFSSAKALCNWAGLTPRVRNSGAVVRHGHISKEGPPLLREAMCQAANVACRRSKRWVGVYKTLANRRGKRIAKVAIARRLLTVVFCMLTRNEPYQKNHIKDRPADQGT
jgi:transposase